MTAGGAKRNAWTWNITETAGLDAFLPPPVNTDIHDGVWRRRPPRSGTLTGGAILRPSIGEWALGVAFVEATFIVVSSCVRKHSAAGAQLYSQLAQLLPCVIPGPATLDTCGVPPQVVPSSLRDLVYKPYVRFPVRVS